MDITFSTTKLQRIFSDIRKMTQEYGDRTKRLKARVDLLGSAPTLADVDHNPPPRRHELKGDWVGHFSVDITGNWRLVFRPTHDPVPRILDGGVDLTKITAVEIVAVIDYHEK
jgi:proteic killer suppression protein